METSGPGGRTNHYSGGKRSLGQIRYLASGANLAWGEDGKTVYITASQVFTAKAKIQGELPLYH